MLPGLIFYSCEEPVLIKIIIYDLLSEIDMQFIIGNELPAVCFRSVFNEWHFVPQVVPQPEIKVAAVCQCIII